MSELFTSTDILFLILNQLPLGVVASCRTVNKKWCQVISHTRAQQFWRNLYTVFAKKIMRLELPFRLLLSKGVWNIDLALDLSRILSIQPRYSKMFIAEGLMTKEQLTVVKTMFRSEGNLYLLYSSVAIVVALRERLITPEQLISMPNSDYVMTLFCNHNGIAALRERLITPEQVMEMPNSSYIWYLFYENYGLVALREGLITVNQIRLMPDHNYIFHLFRNKNGFAALQAKLITPEQFKDIPCINLRHLLSNNGFAMLNEGFITFEQAKSIREKHLWALCETDDGIIALRQHLITTKEIIDLPSFQHVIPFIESRKGRTAPLGN